MNHIVRVHRPELSDDERARRMESIKQAAAALIIAAERNRKHEQHHRNCEPQRRGSRTT